MMFGIPPPGRDPQLESEYGQTPGDRLRSTFRGFIIAALVLVIVAIVLILV